MSIDGFVLVLIYWTISGNPYLLWCLSLSLNNYIRLAFFSISFSLLIFVALVLRMSIFVLMLSIFVDLIWCYSLLIVNHLDEDWFRLCEKIIDQISFEPFVDDHDYSCISNDKIWQISMDLVFFFSLLFIDLFVDSRWENVSFLVLKWNLRVTREDLLKAIIVVAWLLSFLFQIGFYLKGIFVWFILFSSLVFPSE